MSVAAVTPRVPDRRGGALAELGKLRAFLRRDFLVAWSYRVGFFGDLVNLLVQVALFYFVNLMVDPLKMPSIGGTRVSYLAFVTVGMALSTVLQVGMVRMAFAIRHEQVIGTLESLLMTPTSPLVIQLGSVMYDLAYIPVRLGVFMGLVAAVFGVDFRLAGVGPAVLLLVVFLPFAWGLGSASAGAVLTYRQFHGAIALGVTGLGIASGAYFPLDLLPLPAEVVAAIRLNPVAVVLDGMRGALLGGEGWVEVIPRLVLLAPVSGLTMILGVLAFRSAVRRERRLGTLGLY